MKRWLNVLRTQAGLDASLHGDTVTLTPRTVLLCGPEFEAFQLRVQVPTAAVFTLRVNGEAFPCKCIDSPGGADAAHVDTTVAIRVPVVVGDTVSLKLEAMWVSTRGAPQSQVLLDGSFTVPEAMDRFGAPGYTVYVPHLSSLAYLSVGNITSNDITRLEFLTFNLVLLS